MNYLGHVHVARALGRHDPLYLLGSALPDLASMAGVRFDRDRLEPAVAEGVRCHLAADDVFHRHPVFREGSGELRLTLAEAGVSSGPARAAAHVGWELLLDGTLVGTEVEAAYWNAMTHIRAVDDAIRPDDHDRWQAFLRRAGIAQSGAPGDVHRPERSVRSGIGPGVGRRPVVLRYNDPSWVADRVVTALSRRPRLRLLDEHRRTLTTTLTSAAPKVTSQARTLLADITTSL